MTVHLKIRQGSLSGKTISFIEHDTYLVGRAPDVHCRLVDDPHLSRHHAIFEINPPWIRIRDLGSLNGITVNQQHYGGENEDGDNNKNENEKTGDSLREVIVELADGDCVQVGETMFQVSITDEASAADDTSLSHQAAAGDSTEIVAPDGAATVRAHKYELADTPTIPGYQLKSLLNTGGHGHVYLALDESSGENVAIKLLKESHLKAGDMSEKFNREIALTRALDHPNIITYRDHGFVTGAAYLVLDYIPSLSVDLLMQQRGGGIALTEAKPILLGMAEGLAYAHGRGLVHRDLKPSNILLGGTPDAWHALIADLGLAKSFSAAGGSRLTVSGSVGGTCLFMPREQIINFKYLKPVSDVFSLGATMYALLTGECVYDITARPDPLEVVMEGITIPLTERNVTLPPPLVEVITRAVAVDFHQRYRDAIQLRDALGTAIAET